MSSPGLNVAADLRHPRIGPWAEAVLGLLQEWQIELATVDIGADQWSLLRSSRHGALLHHAQGLPFDVTLIIAEAQDAQHVIRHLPLAALAGRRLVGWLDHPLPWLDGAMRDGIAVFDEIWAPTETALRAFEPVLVRPIHRVSPPGSAEAITDDLEFRRRAAPGRPLDVLSVVDPAVRWDQSNILALGEVAARLYAVDPGAARFEVLVLRGELARQMRLDLRWALERAREERGLPETVHLPVEIPDDPPLGPAALGRRLARADLYLDLSRAAAYDPRAVRALLAGTPTLLTDTGFFAELHREQAHEPWHPALEHLAIPTTPAAVPLSVGGLRKGLRWQEPRLEAVVESLEQLAKLAPSFPEIRRRLRDRAVERWISRAGEQLERRVASLLDATPAHP